MAKKKKHAAHEEPNAELLPPRKALSLLNTDPSAYAGLMGDPLAPGSAGTEPATGPASATADSAQDLVDAQAAAEGQETASDQDQTVTTESTQSASSET